LTASLIAPRSVAWGSGAATTQGTDGLKVIDDNIAALRGILADRSKRYRQAPTANRTHLQHALPVMLGYKTRLTSRCSIVTPNGWHN
jgi:hypothetical protein